MSGMNLTNVLIVAGILGYLIDRLADARGWSRSSKTLRRENEDLVRRNTELEQTVHRLEQKVEILERQVDELRRTDQAAVLRSIEQHEVAATGRHERTLAAASQTNELLTRAVKALEKGAS